MAPQPFHELRLADDDSRLRPAEQLVAGEADEAGARGEALARLRLVAERHERARAEVVDECEVVSRRRPSASSASDGRSVKPSTRKFDWCTRSSTAVSGPMARS